MRLEEVEVDGVPFKWADKQQNREPLNFKSFFLKWVPRFSDSI
jgi:hypothetical protein